LGSGTRIGAYEITAPSVDANFATSGAPTVADPATLLISPRASLKFPSFPAGTRIAMPGLQ
jgi:hypothetical protein